MIKNIKIFTILATVILFACAGCASMRHPVPPHLIAKASVRDMNDIRLVMGEHHTPLQKNLIESMKQEHPGDYPIKPDGTKIYPVLAISGGGANGAYGAGFLKGWSKEGSRPMFKIVTGVSTGAIIAPFAFLGKDYDDELEYCYTTMSTKDVMAHNLPFTTLFGNSLTSNAPLARTINKFVTKDILAKIAVEHNRGRRLFIGTANLDTERFVIWDMGAIAVRGDEELFRKVIIASAAIPMIFPPSVFHVEADGKIYDELHADGGTLTQVFGVHSIVEGMDLAGEKLGIDPSKISGRLYIIRNGYMSPTYKRIQNNLPSLAQRSFDMIIDSQSLGDVYRLYVFTKESDNEYNLAFIPSDFEQRSKEMFDTENMRRLFARGYDDAVKGYEWHKTPPGLDSAVYSKK